MFTESGIVSCVACDEVAVARVLSGAQRGSAAAAQRSRRAARPLRRRRRRDSAAGALQQFSSQASRTAVSAPYAGTHRVWHLRLSLKSLRHPPRAEAQRVYGRNKCLAHQQTETPRNLAKRSKAPTNTPTMSVIIQTGVQLRFFYRASALHSASCGPAKSEG